MVKLCLTLESGRKIMSEVVAECKKNGAKKVAVTGYCWGGKIAALLACEESTVDVAVPCFPGSRINLMSGAFTGFSDIKRPTHFVFAELDTNPSHATATEALELGKRKEFGFSGKVYPGVDHGFAIRGDPKDENCTKMREEAFADGLAFLNAEFAKLA